MVGLHKYSPKSRQRITDEKGYPIDVALMNKRSDAFGDFVICENRKAILAVQVSYDISSDKTRKREVAGLILAARKTGCENLLLLTDHNYEDISQDGYSISIRPAYDFVLKSDF